MPVLNRYSLCRGQRSRNHGRTVSLTKTPATVDDQLFAALRAEFTEPQLVELATAIAWENYRARFNRTFAILADGFSEGAFCPLPEA